MKALVLAITAMVFCLGTSGARADNSDAMEIARAYLEVYQAFDVERLETLYDENAVFADPTSFALDLPQAPYNWRGRDEILSNLKTYRDAYEETYIRYQIETSYVFSETVVFIGQAELYSRGGGLEYRSFAPIVTVVTIKNGLVVEHRDYVDYATGAANAVVTEAPAGPE